MAPHSANQKGWWVMTTVEEGVVLGLAIANEQRRAFDADSKARRSDSEALRAKLRADSAEEDERLALRQRDQWRQRCMKSEEIMIYNEREASAGFLLVNSMIESLDMIPVDIRTKFVQQIVSLTSAKIDRIDARFTAQAKAEGKSYRTIREVFSKDPEYTKLGFDK